MSSRPEPLLEEPGWLRNGAGRQFSHKFGYGLMDAERIVDLATNWRTLPSQHICQTVIMVPNAPISGTIHKPCGHIFGVFDPSPFMGHFT